MAIVSYGFSARMPSMRGSLSRVAVRYISSFLSSVDEDFRRSLFCSLF
jgi:hypothetical protein